MSATLTFRSWRHERHMPSPVWHHLAAVIREWMHDERFWMMVFALVVAGLVLLLYWISGAPPAMPNDWMNPVPNTLRYYGV